MLLVLVHISLDVSCNSVKCWFQLVQKPFHSTIFYASKVHACPCKCKFLLEPHFSTDGELLKNIPRLTRLELELACEDFSNIIGSTNETVVYKGTLKNGPEVAVISLCISHANWSNYHEFFYQSKVSHQLSLWVLYDKLDDRKKGTVCKSQAISQVKLYWYYPGTDWLSFNEIVVWLTW